MGAVSVRRCIVCRSSSPKPLLLRFVWQEGRVCVDRDCTRPGRGAYVHCSEDCLRKIAAPKLWMQAFRLKKDMVLRKDLASLLEDFIESGTIDQVST